MTFATIPNESENSTTRRFVEAIRQHNERPLEDERRSEPRYALSVPIWVQPLLFDFSPDGPNYKTVTRDISDSGIGFVQSEPMRHKYAELQLAKDGETPERVIVEIRHCTQIGYMGLLQLVGAVFLPDGVRNS